MKDMPASICFLRKNYLLYMLYHFSKFVGDVLLHPVYYYGDSNINGNFASALSKQFRAG